MKEKFPHITKVLIALAERMCDNPEQYTVEDGKNLDRALRTCPDIYDIHTVWVLWSYVAEKQGWLTDHEMISTNRGKWIYK